MKCYIVSFQIPLRARRDKLRTLLKKYEGFCPINTTCWAIKTDRKASEVRDHLKVVLAEGDRLFVLRSGTEAAWRNPISERHSEWLKKNL
jgi:hypothetical protein